jgi:predicted KAP-like P-loop ATPase
MSRIEQKIELLSDDAIKSSDHDKFDRTNFVHSIANIIHSQSTRVNQENDVDFKSAHENLIIGIFGEWGLGKSSIINLLDESLDKKGLKTVYFNPWMYGNEEQVIISLFNIIIKEYGENTETQDKLIELFKKYAPLVSVVSSKAGAITNAIIDTIGEKESIDAHYCKEKIDKLLAGTAQPLIIFIDDVDRLSKDEIHVLFKTLRLIASFKHIIYVVACDFEMVAKSIKENYADGQVEDGRSFIEKIIQIPIRIPEIKPENLFNFGADLISKTTGINAKGNATFNLLFERYFKTPRDVKRFINGFRYTHSYMKGILPDDEILVLELIRVKVHSLFQIIKIYYQAIGAIDTDIYYGSEFMLYVKKQRKDFFKADGTFDKQNKEYLVYTQCFTNLFGINSIITLQYTSMSNSNNKVFSFKQVMLEAKIDKLSSLKNPFKLVEYFEKTPDLTTR